MKIEETISDFHDEKICYTSKTIKCFGEITDAKKEEVISNLHILDQTTGQVTILLSSEGGCVTAGLAIFDAIRAMKNRVRIICYGEVASIATVILQGADEGLRCLMPNAYLMIHEGETSRSGSEKDIAQQKRLQDWHESKCNDIYLKSIKEKKKRFTKKKLLDLMDRDRVLLPKEAIEYGLIDEILEVY